MSKELVFQSVESLQQVVNVINEAAAALNDKTRTIRESPIPEVLAGALGAGIGGIGSLWFRYCRVISCWYYFWPCSYWQFCWRWYGSWSVCNGSSSRCISRRRYIVSF